MICSTVDLDTCSLKYLSRNVFMACLFANAIALSCSLCWCITVVSDMFVALEREEAEDEEDEEDEVVGRCGEVDDVEEGARGCGRKSELPFNTISVAATSNKGSLNKRASPRVPTVLATVWTGFFKSICNRLRTLGEIESIKTNSNLP